MHELRKVGAPGHDLIHTTDNTGQVGQDRMLNAGLGVGLELLTDLLGVADKHDLLHHLEGDGGSEVAEVVGVEVMDDHVDEALAVVSKGMLESLGGWAAGSFGVTLDDPELFAVLLGAHPPGGYPSVAVLAGQSQHPWTVLVEGVPERKEAFGLTGPDAENEVGWFTKRPRRPRSWPRRESTVRSSPPSLPAPQQKPSAVVPLRGMRGTIAKRMHAPLRDMAQLSLFMDADVGAVVADREARKAAGSAPSYTDYVIAAAARALVEHPAVNAQVTDDGIALLPEIHIGMAVALDEGLIVPVIRNTAGRNLADLAAESGRLADAARAGSLGFGDLEGGTFSVSTLGMYGVDGFTPVINPPNAAILGVGRLRDDVVLADDGTPRTVTRLTLSLTWDHRVFDGAPAAAFTKRIVELLADPAGLDAI